MSPAAQDDLVRVARIGKPHGIRGEVTVQVFTDDPDARFAPGERLVVRDGAPGLPAELTVTRYVVDGELKPRPADAKRGLSEIPGLLTKAPDEVAASAPADTGPPEPSVADLPNAARFRGLFGRR